jgi:hypothetical protein
VFDSGLEGRCVFVALVVWHAIEPGKPPAPVSVTLSGGGHRCSVCGKVAGVSRHLWEMAGDDVGGLGRPGQRAVVDRRERHGTQPPAQPVRLLATELRKASVRGVTGRRILFAVADEVQLCTSHRRPTSGSLFDDEHDRSRKHG